jgi:hypothetical protein
MTTRISLTDEERKALCLIAEQTGKAEDELLHEAVEQLIRRYEQAHRAGMLQQAVGMWRDRTDLPEWERLRGEFDMADEIGASRRGSSTWREVLIGVGAFLFGIAWRYSTMHIAAGWYGIINRFLQNPVRMIDEQPAWGKVLQTFVEYLPGIGLILLIIWGAKKRRWLPPVAYWIGTLVADVCMSYQISQTMRNFD